MPTKELGPLPQSQRDGDVLKKQVDSTIKESEKSIKNQKLKDRESRLSQLYLSCTDTAKLVDDLVNKVKDLKEEDEPKPIKGYENKKTNELKRLEQFKSRLEVTLAKFPDEVKPKLPEPAVDPQEDEEEDVDEEEEEEESGEEEEDDELEDEEGSDVDEESEVEDGKDHVDSTMPSIKKPSGESIAHKLEEKKSGGEVSKTGEVSDEDNEDVSEEEEEDDEEEVSGEEEVEEEDEASEDEAEDESGEEEEEARENEEDLEFSTTMRLFEAVSSYEAEQPEDLSFKKGDLLMVIKTSDDGWWEAENEKGDKGIVPKTYLKLHNKYRDVQELEEETAGEDALTPTSRKSGKELWKGIKTALLETSVSDVLHAMGAVPSGFRVSTLAQKFSEDQYRMKHHLAPKLSKSQVAFKDLFLDPSKNRIRPRTMWIEKLVTLTACRQIPPPGTGVEVLDRFVRVCLFDGEKILSNIHCIHVASVDKTARTWNFANKIADNMDTFQHAEIFVRTSHNISNLALLFELGITYERTSTKETGELSCGWSSLPLVEADGSCVINRNYDMYVNGGTPYERGVEVDPSISRRAASSALMSLMSGNKQPRIVAKVSNLKQIHTEWLQALPDTLIGNVSLLNFYSYYRQVLADCLLRDRIDLESTEPLHSPVLVNFPEVADQHDLMNYFRSCWQETTKTVTQSNKRDEEYVKNLFKKVFMENIYPISHSASLPPYKTGDSHSSKERAAEITRFRVLKQKANSPLSALCSPEINFTPFLVSEVSFSVIGRYSQKKPVHVKAG